MSLGVYVIGGVLMTLHIQVNGKMKFCSWGHFELRASIAGE